MAKWSIKKYSKLLKNTANWAITQLWGLILDHLQPILKRKISWFAILNLRNVWPKIFADQDAYQTTNGASYIL